MLCMFYLQEKKQYCDHGKIKVPFGSLSSNHEKVLPYQVTEAHIRESSDIIAAKNQLILLSIILTPLVVLVTRCCWHHRSTENVEEKASPWLGATEEWSS